MSEVYQKHSGPSMPEEGTSVISPFNSEMPSAATHSYLDGYSGFKPQESMISRSSGQPPTEWETPIGDSFVALLLLSGLYGLFILRKKKMFFIK